MLHRLAVHDNHNLHVASMGFWALMVVPDDSVGECAPMPNDIVEVRPSSRDLTPFVVARAEAGEKNVPAWLEAIPSKMRILVHSLPERQVIDTQVQEQLIVELYSK